MAGNLQYEKHTILSLSLRNILHTNIEIDLSWHICYRIHNVKCKSNGNICDFLRSTAIDVDWLIKLVACISIEIVIKQKHFKRHGSFSKHFALRRCDVRINNSWSIAVRADHLFVCFNLDILQYRLTRAVMAVMSNEERQPTHKWCIDKYIIKQLRLTSDTNKTFSLRDQMAACRKWTQTTQPNPCHFQFTQTMRQQTVKQPKF